MVAATRRGFGCEGPPAEEDGWGMGVEAPVAMGVERLDGSSEEKMVPEDGEM